MRGVGSSKKDIYSYFIFKYYLNILIIKFRKINLLNLNEFTWVMDKYDIQRGSKVKLLIDSQGTSRHHLSNYSLYSRTTWTILERHSNSNRDSKETSNTRLRNFKNRLKRHCMNWTRK